MTDGDVYLLSASSTETCDTLYSSNKEEIEVASAVQPYEGEPRASIANEDVDGVWQSRFLACGVQVKIRTKKTPVTECLWMLRLCYVLNGEVYVQNR